MTATKQTALSWMAIMGGNGTMCHGHVIWRGRLGIEAFNVDDRSIGLFPTIKDATAALAGLAAPS
jgi:hypothetical protein